jgi:hypothetical protein
LFKIRNRTICEQLLFDFDWICVLE